MTDNLTESYKIYKMKERLDNENSYDCTNCKIKTIARKKITIVKWPSNLIIVLKDRFTT